MRQFINPAPFVLMLLVGSCHLSSDSVQISLSLRHQFAAPILILFHHFQSLQGLEDPLGHALGAFAEVAGHDIVPLMLPIDLGHGANPSATPGVQVLCRGSSSCIEPVLIVGRKFFMLGQLDGVHSFRDFQLTGLFEEGCQISDELLLVDVFYSNSRHCVASVLPARGKGKKFLLMWTTFFFFHLFLLVGG